MVSKFGRFVTKLLVLKLYNYTWSEKCLQKYSFFSYPTSTHILATIPEIPPEWYFKHLIGILSNNSFLGTHYIG